MLRSCRAPLFAFALLASGLICAASSAWAQCRACASPSRCVISAGGICHFSEGYCRTGGGCKKVFRSGLEAAYLFQVEPADISRLLPGGEPSRLLHVASLDLNTVAGAIHGAPGHPTVVASDLVFGPGDGSSAYATPLGNGFGFSWDPQENGVSVEGYAVLNGLRAKTAGSAVLRAGDVLVIRMPIDGVDYILALGGHAVTSDEESVSAGLAEVNDTILPSILRDGTANPLDFTQLDLTLPEMSSR